MYPDLADFDCYSLFVIFEDLNCFYCAIIVHSPRHHHDLSPPSTTTSSTSSSPEETTSDLLSRYNAAFVSVSTTPVDTMGELLDEVQQSSTCDNSGIVPLAMGVTSKDSSLVDRLR